MGVLGLLALRPRVLYLGALLGGLSYGLTSERLNLDVTCSFWVNISSALRL